MIHILTFTTHWNREYVSLISLRISTTITFNSWGWPNWTLWCCILNPLLQLDLGCQNRLQNLAWQSLLLCSNITSLDVAIMFTAILLWWIEKIEYIDSSSRAFCFMTKKNVCKDTRFFYGVTKKILIWEKNRIGLKKNTLRKITRLGGWFIYYKIVWLSFQWVRAVYSYFPTWLRSHMTLNAKKLYQKKQYKPV